MLKKVKYIKDGVDTTGWSFCNVITKIKTPNDMTINLFNTPIYRRKIISSSLAEPAYNCIDCKKMFAESTFTEKLTLPQIDIIIPIYNGFSFLESLFNSIKINTDLPYRLIVIEDKSTDLRVVDYLQRIKTEFCEKIHIVFHQTNMGFVKSVNEGLSLAKNNVVILNSDTQLPSNWASRLFAPIFSDRKVASVTPFSNAANIFSLPNIGEDNDFNGDLEKINAQLSKMASPPYADLQFPTGHGFCLALNKEAIEKIGVFDEIFEKGYGEENDWCQRAVAAGYINTIAPNLFVWHKHAGSFDAKDRIIMLENSANILCDKYPNYTRDVCCSTKDDDFRSIRFIAMCFYFSAISKQEPKILKVNENFHKELLSLLLQKNQTKDQFFVFIRNNDFTGIELMYLYNGYSDCMIFNESDLIYILHALGLSKDKVGSVFETNESGIPLKAGVYPIVQAYKTPRSKSIFICGYPIYNKVREGDSKIIKVCNRVLFKRVVTCFNKEVTLIGRRVQVKQRLQIPIKNNKIKNILFISHELSYTGGPLSLLSMCKVTKELGYNVCVWSLREGDFAPEFIKANINVQILPLDSFNGALTCQIKNFDLSICNTVVTYKAHCYLRKFIPSILFIRESKNLLEFVKKDQKLFSLLATSKDLYCVSEYAATTINEKFYNNAKILLNFVDTNDFSASPLCFNTNDILNILIIGTIQDRKGQLVVVQALESLQQRFRDRIKLTIVGRAVHHSYFQEIQKYAISNKHVEIFDEISDKGKLNEIYSNAHIVAVPSFDESFSRVVCEALAVGRPVLVTNNVGAKFLINKNNGWIVDAGNEVQVAQIFNDILLGKYDLPAMGKAAYEAHLAYNDYNTYKNNVAKMIESYL